jgi:hypothetical protein
MCDAAERVREAGRVDDAEKLTEVIFARWRYKAGSVARAHETRNRGSAR